MKLWDRKPYRGKGWGEQKETEKTINATSAGADLPGQLWKSERPKSPKVKEKMSRFLVSIDGSMRKEKEGVRQTTAHGSRCYQIRKTSGHKGRKKRGKTGGVGGDVTGRIRVRFSRLRRSPRAWHGREGYSGGVKEKRRLEGVAVR